MNKLCNKTSALFMYTSTFRTKNSVIFQYKEDSNKCSLMTHTWRFFKRASTRTLNFIVQKYITRYDSGESMGFIM